MIRGVIWLAAAGLFALATHLAYVLFLPRYEMSRLMEVTRPLASRAKV